MPGDLGPGRQEAGGGERSCPGRSRHDVADRSVRPGDLVSRAAVSGNGVRFFHLDIEAGDVDFGRIDPGQHPGEQEPVVLVEGAHPEPGESFFGHPILDRIRVRASSANPLGSRSPAIMAAIISRPETPNMSEATTDSFRQASSSRFSTRFFSAPRTPTRSMR